MQLCSAIVTVQTYYNYFSNFFIYLRKRALQLCPSKFSKSLERAECTSVVCDNTAVVSQRNWSLSISHSVHKIKHCINSYNGCVLMIKPFHCWCFGGKVTHCCFTTVVSQQISRLYSTRNAKTLH